MPLQDQMGVQYDGYATFRFEFILLIALAFIMLQEREQEEIEAIVADTLGHLLQNFDYEKMSMPLIRNTFTLWRNLTFKRIAKLPFYSHKKQKIEQWFYQLVECKYRRIFIDKIEAAEQSFEEVANTVDKGMSIESQKQVEMMAKYSRALWKHTLYCELFEDILSIPYLTFLFPSNKKYRLSARYSQLSPLRSSEKGGEMMEKVSEGVLKKGFGELVEKVFTRTFLLRASSIAIRLNPVAIAATFAFSTLMDYYRREKREEEVMGKLQEMITRCCQNVEILQATYQQCTGLLGGLLKGDEQAKKIFLQKVSSVIEEDWLQVVRCKDDDGWQVVILQGDPQQQK